jgi:hypothetical protein
MKYIVRYVFICIVLIILIQQVSLAEEMQSSNSFIQSQKWPYSNYLSLDSKKDTPAPDTQTILDNELEEPNDSSITTKIYRSNDPALDLIENDTEVNTTSFSDLINKEELINKKKGSKIVERKIARNDGRGRVGFVEQLKRLLMPWFITIVLAVGLTLIFKYVIKRA